MIELVYKECKANNVIVYGSAGTGAVRQDSMRGGGGEEWRRWWWEEEVCNTPIKMIRANNVLKYQSLDQSLVQYIIQVIYSSTTFLFKYNTLQHNDKTN
jgi:hypothetical protein